MNVPTQVLHSGYLPDPQTGSTSVPVYQTASYAFATAQEIADAFGGRGPGFIYSRISNPTNAAFERRLAELEGGVGCIACSSGMAAISSTVMGLTRAGDHVVAAKGIFGGTVSLLSRTLSRFGVSATFVDSSNVEDVKTAIRPETKLVFVETIANPRMDVPDLPAIAEVVHKAGIPLVVDSTVTTPVLIRPGEWGADIVIHSVSKFINGHGNSIGGAVVDTGRFDWSEGPFEDIAQLARKAGKLAFIAHLRTLVYRDLGCCPSPFNSFLNLVGLEGLAIRMEAHCRNALHLAEFLAQHPKVEWVRYPGLSSDPCYETASRLFQGGFGGVLTFGVGSAEAAMKLIDRLALAQNLANIGDSRTLVIHPASTIFQEFTTEEREAMGVPDDMIRVSAGVESSADIIADFESALAGI